MTAVLEPVPVPDLLGTAPADLIDPGTDLPVATRDVAVRRAERIRAGVASYAAMRQDIADAYAHRDWLALDYDSWHAYLDGEFGHELRRLTRDERPAAVADLRGQGMSTRQIADVTGVDDKTVRNDLAQVRKNSAPEVMPERVTGSDGKSYAARRETPPAVSDAARHAFAQQVIDERVATGELIRLVGGNVIEAKSFDPAVHARLDEPIASERKPAKWDPAERKAHEAEVQRIRDIEAARRASQNIVTEVRGLVVTVVSGSRLGERGLVTTDMIRELREAIDLLEAEL